MTETNIERALGLLQGGMEALQKDVAEMKNDLKTCIPEIRKDVTDLDRRTTLIEEVTEAIQQMHEKQGSRFWDVTKIAITLAIGSVCTMLGKWLL